jgi:hypothetical protein
MGVTQRITAAVESSACVLSPRLSVATYRTNAHHLKKTMRICRNGDETNVDLFYQISDMTWQQFKCRNLAVGKTVAVVVPVKHSVEHLVTHVEHDGDDSTIAICAARALLAQVYGTTNIGLKYCSVAQFWDVHNKSFHLPTQQ